MRWESLFAMSSSVFMKGLRDLRYRDLFSNERYRGRVVANLIYDLATSRRRTGMEELGPSPGVRALAERTRDLPTCLWFNQPAELDEAILCGRLTACHNLLRHLRELPPERSEEVSEIRGKLTSLWQTLEAEAEAARTNEPHSIQPPPSTLSLS